LPIPEKLLELFDIQVISTGEIRAGSQFERKPGIVEGGEDIWNDGLFVDVNTQDLPFLVDPDNAIRSFMLCGDKDRLTGDTIKVYASGRFEIVKMDETILRDQVYDAVLLGYLHRYGKVVGSFWGVVDIDFFFDERRLIGRGIDFYNMQLKTRLSNHWTTRGAQKVYLGSSCCAHRKYEKFCGILATIQLYVCECGSVTLDGLTDASVLVVQLHCAFYSKSGRIHCVSGYADYDEPIFVRGNTVIDYLSPS
jgi:hypothetical protein